MTAAVAAPRFTTCACCGDAIPAGQVWCSQLCRNLDDRHDQDDTEQEQAA